MNKGDLALHKLKGNHSFKVDGLWEICGICGYKRQISEEPLWEENRRKLFLPDVIATQKGLIELCQENYAVYNQPIEDIYVTPQGARQLEADYMGESRFMQTHQDPHYADRNRGRYGQSVFDITNIVTGEPIRVNVVRDRNEAEEILGRFLIMASNTRKFKRRNPIRLSDLETTITYDES